jgi:arginine deiminase
VSHVHGVDSEVGQLRTVLTHRPGAELRRITPRTRDPLLFAGLPWVSRAQQEHDALTQALRDHDVEVLYVTELLQDTLEYPAARQEAVAAAVDDPRLGEQLRADLRRHLTGLDPEVLAQTLVAGLTTEEFRPGRGLVYGLLGRHDFVLDPLPHLVFTRDSSVWIGPSAVVTSLAGPARRRECALIRILYRHHPRFAGADCIDEPDMERLDGGDVLQLAPGVVAVGVGDRTISAAAERLAGRLFTQGLADTVLAVPMAHAPLDTVCTVIDVGTVLMFPALAYQLCAHTITPGPDGLRVSCARPFLDVAAQAMGVAAVTVISTGLDPAGIRQQWDDGSNTLVVAPGLVVSHERNTDTHTRLEDAGVEVVKVPGSELGSGRGGPRAMSCPVSRDSLARPGDQAPAGVARDGSLAPTSPDALVPAATSALG